jgi:ArsR family transcriptional regulator
MLDTLKALADPCRLRLTAVLLAGEFTVQELTRIMGMGQSRISRHLKILSEAGVLAVKRQGTWSYYRAGEGSSFFAGIRPAFEREMKALPQRSEDLAAVAAVLEERRRRSQEFFDCHARQWDDLARTLLPLPEYRRRLLELLPEGVTVLEIGIGTGGLLTELADRASQVIGVDHSPAMLEEARRRLTAAAITGVELRLGEMSHLPLPDASVGCVVANMVLHHAANPAQVLSEIRRVLARGGSLLLADLARHEREAAREQLADQWLGFEEAELAGWLKAAGFAEVAIERITAATGQESVLLVHGHTNSLNNPTDSTIRKGA